MGGALRIGVIGVGNISAQYFETLPRLGGLELVAVADLAGGAVIATVDVVDMSALAGHAKDVKVVSIQP